jgi:UDP-3-O-[3-hydroxymyristoyl] glucosamine N-acyltransferase
MNPPFFFSSGRGLTVREIGELTKATLRAGADPERRISGIAALDRATIRDLTFLDRGRFVEKAGASVAGACVTTEGLAPRLAERVCVLCVAEPYRAFVEAARALFPEALRPSSLFDASGVAATALVHPAALQRRSDRWLHRSPTAPRAEVGSGTLIGAGAVIGPNVRIGRNCSIGARASITNALLGDRVIVHPGCSIGQDGFGFVMGPRGHRKVPQVGRVIIQDDVEVGANSTIDRGGVRDTVIGEGTKIDNLVQIGHNVTIGRNCIIVSQCGISGSCTINDHVVLAGQVGLADNVTIGEGAMVGAQSGVSADIPAGEKWFGYPAMRGRAYMRGIMKLQQLAAGRKRGVDLNAAGDMDDHPADKG